MLNPCRITGQPTVALGIDFGPQPICHRFLADHAGPEPTHRLAVGLCERTGLVQLIGPAPVSLLTPVYPWIVYNEPERHLDDLVERLVAAGDLKVGDLLFGVSYKDRSTLERMRKRGFSNTACTDPSADFGGIEPGGGIESIQERLTVETARHIAARRGRPRLVVMRHILEHCHDLPEVAAALKQLVAPEGRILFEVPDASRALEHLDYTTIWEEHVFYFTPETLRCTLKELGFAVEWLHSYEYTHENSLVAVVRPQPAGGDRCCAGPATLDAEISRAGRFMREFESTRENVRRSLLEFSIQRGGICFLGAGHLTCSFINLMGIADLIEFVADDDPNKAGKLMPGSRRPILGSRALVERDVKLCLFSVRPEIEEAIVNKSRAFLERGGQMGSIFPMSPFAWPFRHGSAGQPIPRAA